MDRAQLADFLRTRREALQPEDVGLPRGPRRRTRGLRREEAASLCGMSTDYYGRLEQQRGPQPSEAMLAAMARGLHLSLAERDHLFRIAGHNTPSRSGLRSDHVTPGLMRILGRLDDTPAQVVNDVAETLVQTSMAAALLGDQTRFTGPERSFTYRWFTDPSERLVYAEEDHPLHSRFFASGLRDAYSRQGAGGRAGELVELLHARSEEFAALWAAHEIGVPKVDPKRVRHPELGVLSLQCQVLTDPDQNQSLLVYTAVPGSKDDERLRLLPVLGVRAAGT
ncbi:helix-turn-helix transcriptional regulator [Streptomyces sp. NPDC046985]|uniref:helix-turn-helix transcriptional regulator n=1 Tax=Streptomyces sp. NPDC046985 TaxID=3155377 RepID=UPI0033F20503